MRLDKDGDFINFETKIKTVKFEDPNGRHEARVYTDGEFWRVVSVNLPNASLTPKAAKALGRAMIRAADVARAEEKRIKRAQRNR